MILLLLMACPATTKESGDSAIDTGGGDTGGGDTGDRTSLAQASASFVGSPSDAAGSTVLGPGDIDGDGAADVVVGAYYGDRVCWFRGPIAEGRHDLDAADGCWSGEGTYDFAGYALSDAGDVDGDGATDFLIGAVGNADAGANAGKVYVMAGPPASGVVSLTGSYATWAGEAGADYAGIGLGSGGDLTGDGIDDLLVGASGNDAGGAGGGKAYVVAGPILPGAHLLADVDITFLGAASASPPALAHGSLGGGDLVGDALAGPGDLDGDGVDDLVLGAGGNERNGVSAGVAAIWHGPLLPGVYALTEADQLWYGPAAGAFAGSPVRAGGDLDDDGLPDTLVAADGLGAGTVFLVPGSSSSGEYSLADTAVQFIGETTGDQAGAALGAPGNSGADGVSMIVVGAPSCDSEGVDAGVVYVYSGPFAPGVYGPADATERLAGEHAADSAGRALAPSPDVTGDGLPDLLVGAIYNDDGGAFSGKAYLLAGR